VEPWQIFANLKLSISRHQVGIFKLNRSHRAQRHSSKSLMISTWYW
jgi:hypothetical protein